MEQSELMPYSGNFVRSSAIIPARVGVLTRRIPASDTTLENFWSAKVDRVEITTLHDGYPFSLTYSLQNLSMERVPKDEAIDYLKKRAAVFESEITPSLNGAIAARRMTNLNRIVNDLEHPTGNLWDVRPEALALRTPPIEKTGKYVIVGEYIKDQGHIGAWPCDDEVYLECIDMDSPFSEKLVAQLMKEQYPKGFGAIIHGKYSEHNKEMLDSWLTDYKAYEVPKDFLDLVEPSRSLEIRVRKKK